MTVIQLQDGNGNLLAELSFPTYDHAHDFFQEVQMPAEWTSRTLSDNG